MNRGAKYLACTALLANAACGGEHGKLEIRSMPTPLAQGVKPVSFRVAEGHQQFALGNIALALESYRKAWRDDPSSTDALAGIAASYDRMGRFDLAARSYEAALAIEPGNTTVLAMLAASLDQQGKKAEALAVRDEIRQRLVAARLSADAPAGTKIAEAEVEAAMPVPDLAAIQPGLNSAPLAVPAGTMAPAAVVAAFAPDEPVKAPAAIAALPAKPAAPTAVASPAKPAKMAVATPPAAPAAMAAAAPPATAKAKAVAATPAASVAMAAIAPPARTVTIALPKPIPAAPPAARPPEQPVPQPARPQAPAPVATEVAAVTLPARPARPPVALPVAVGRAPTLERTSLGEVALVTANEPRWSSLVVKQTQRSATVRFVPLRQANARFASVRLLNAARVQGLAANTRSTLFNRGWRSIAIGNASAIRARSLVLYPAHRRSTALSLARQFGFATAQRASGREITVLLGRDAALLARRLPAA